MRHINVRLFALALTLSLLAACGFAQTLSDTSEKAAQIKAELAKTLGGSPDVGWRVQNDHVAQVTVQLSSFPHEEMSIADLKKEVRRVVEEKMNPMPDQIVISLSVN